MTTSFIVIHKSKSDCIIMWLSIQLLDEVKKTKHKKYEKENENEKL